MRKDIKIVYAEEFTKSVSNPEDIVNSDVFYARILISIAGSISAELDSMDVYSVIRIGFPTSILKIVYEMGRSERG